MSGTVSLLGVSKFFGDAQALDDVSFTLTGGTVHALVGENGAGKSTALRILAGLEQPSTGSILVDAVETVVGSRAAAIRAGIGLVPQQLSLIADMDLAENLLLTQPSQLVHRRAAERLLATVAAEAGLAISVRTPVRSLGLAERQLGELAIALAQGASILLLDEPTSALGPYESQALFDKVRALAAAGVTILLITHRLDEVRLVADDVTVLSHGRVTLSAPVASVTDDELVLAMVGSIPDAQPRQNTVADEVRLELDGVVVSDGGIVALEDVSLTVRAGEILGVLGVAGNGQGALADTAVGITRVARGSVTVNGTAIAGRPDVASNLGVAYVPEVRSDFLLPDSALTRSSVLRRLGDRIFSRGGVLRWGRIERFTADLLERHDVRPRNPRQLAGSLSGGNQQKLLVGRELDGTPAVAVLHGPTQGLDLHAAATIRGKIRRAADAGTAVLLVSADVDEVTELADRILVMSKGRIVDQFAIEDLDLQRLGRAMAGLVDSND